MGVLFMLPFLLIPGMFAVLAYYLAESRNRERFLWAILTFLFPPFVVLILCLGRIDKGYNTKVCPFCAEQIQEKAIRCRYCLKDL